MKRWVEIGVMLCFCYALLRLGEMAANSARYIVLKAYTPIYIEKRVEVVRNITTTTTVMVVATSTKKR